MGKALCLQRPRFADPFPNGSRSLSRTCLQQLFFAEARYLHMQVDAIQQGTRDLLLILADVAWGAGTLTEEVSKVATGAGVHGGDEGKVCRVGIGGMDSGDIDDAIFEWLAQH